MELPQKIKKGMLTFKTKGRQKYENNKLNLVGFSPQFGLPDRVYGLPRQKSPLTPSCPRR